MEVYKGFSELALGINKSAFEIEAAWGKWIGRSYMYVGEVEVKKHFVNNEMYFVMFNTEDSNDCKEYMMNYELKEYEWKVYVDDIEGWQNCKVIDIDNTRLGINRATVICESGTQLNRVVKFVLDEDDEEFKPNGYIYFMEKE